MNKQELRPCRFCNYTKEKHDKKYKDTTTPVDFELYKMEIFYDRILSSWAIQCNKCGTLVITPDESREHAIDFYNEGIEGLIKNIGKR